MPARVGRGALIGKLLLFHQGNFGAGYPKPTRLLVFAKERFTLPSFCYEGPPSFNNEGFYLGPLPMAKGMGSIRNRSKPRTEMWPAKMCQWISSMLLSSWASSATTASKGVPDTQSREDKETSRETAEKIADTFPICQPEGARVLGGFGPPRTCDLPGVPRDFHDGGGLCSPEMASR